MFTYFPHNGNKKTALLWLSPTNNCSQDSFTTSPQLHKKRAILSLLFKHCVVFIVINLLPLGLANFPTRLCRHKSKSLSSVKNEIQIQANPAFCLAQLILSLTFFFHSCDKISSFCKFHFFFSHRRQILWLENKQTEQKFFVVCEKTTKLCKKNSLPTLYVTGRGGKRMEWEESARRACVQWRNEDFASSMHENRELMIKKVAARDSSRSYNVDGLSSDIPQMCFLHG